MSVRNLTFAVDSNGSFCVLTDVEELPDNGVIWCTPIHKEQIMMFKARVCKTSGIIHLLVETDDSGDVVFPKVRNVGLRSVQRIPCGKRKNELVNLGGGCENKVRQHFILYFSITILYFAFWMRSTEGKELSWNDPV